MLKYSIIQRNRAAGSKVWYLRTFDTETKKIYFESLGTEKKGEAQNVLFRRNAERFKTAEEIKREQEPTIKNAVESWLDFVSRGNAGTYTQYKNKIPFFLEFCERNKIKKVSDFSTAFAVSLVDELPKEQKAQTIINKKRVYSTFFNWAYAKYSIEKINPFQRVKTPKVLKDEKEFWTVEQIEQIFNVVEDKEERLLFAFMAFAGLRFFEAAGLYWERIEGGQISITGKGGKFARVPIGEHLKREIELFLNGTDQPSTGRIFRKFINFRENEHLKKYCKKLGLSGSAHCHKFRHSFASNLLRAGGSIIAVSKLMRHEKPDITLRVYSHCLPNDLDKTLNLL